MDGLISSAFRRHMWSLQKVNVSGVTLPVDGGFAADRINQILFATVH